MTDLVRYEDNRPALAELPATTRWVEMLAPAADLAKQIAGTEFVPSAFRNAPAAIAAAILYGQELGIGPMQALAKIDIIEGRPAPRAELARALALSAGHDVWVVEQSTTKCTVAGRRRGSDEIQRVTWTMDDAKKAGLDGRQNWRKFPRQMLLARASAELVRMAFPDVLGGVAYFAEELEGDGEPATVSPLPARSETTPPAGTQRRKRNTPAPAMPPATGEQPPLPGEDDTPTGDAAVDVEELATDAQVKALQTIYTEIGINADDRKPTSMAILALDVLPSHKALTVAQASELIDRLVDVNEGRLDILTDADGHPTGLTAHTA